MASRTIHMTRGPFGTVKTQDKVYGHIRGGSGIPTELDTAKNLREAKRLAKKHGFKRISFIENMGAQRPHPRIIEL